MIAIAPVAVGLLTAILLLLAALSFRRAMTQREVTPMAGRPSGSPMDVGRYAPAAAIFVAVLFLTRWPVLALVSAALAIAWPRLLRGDDADTRRDTLEGIARWLEDLRDTLRGSALTIDDALEHVARRPPPLLAPAFARYLHHRRLGFRTEDALVDLAADLAHPLADAAVSAIRLIIGGSAGTGRLHATVNALAAAARDEVTARERIDRTRSIYRSSMKRLVVIAVFLIAYLRIAGGDLLSPYGTPAGQVVLVIPLAMWAGCIMWLHRLCDERRIAAR